MIRITSRRDGFRRAGIAHPAQPTDYPDEAFTGEQLALLQAEPMLTLEFIDDAPPTPAAARRPRRRG